MSSSTVISHSEVESYLICEQRHFYAFGDSSFGDHAGLEPKSFSDSLYRGIAGHEALEHFYKALSTGSSWNDAIELSQAACRNMALRPNPKFEILTDLATRILPRFYDYAQEKFRQGWRPAYVEKEFRLEVKFGDIIYVYPFKPDVVMWDPAKNLWVWDHKFVYNFYSDDEIKLLPQIPKYIGALRALDYPIKGGYYNQLRWREVKDLQNHNRQDAFVPSDTRIKNAFRQQVRVMEQIGKLKRGSLEEWRDNVNRTLNSMVCKSCSFKHLCAAELNGSDGILMRKAEFISNSYGYSEKAMSDA